MKLSAPILIFFFVSFHLYTNVVLGQREFANAAVTDPAPCACDTHANACDANCCCDPDCTDDDLRVSPACQSGRSSASTTSEKLNTWNCSNETSAGLYDYFPFVCVQLTLNEITRSVQDSSSVAFVKAESGATSLRSTFVNDHPDLFQSATLSIPPFAGSYTRGAPIFQSTTAPFTLPGSRLGFNCQQNVEVLFGINSDISCTTTSFPTTICNQILAVTSILSGAGTSATIPITFLSKTFSASSVTPISSQDYFFQDGYTQTIANIVSTAGNIVDYCPGEHPTTRTQRYNSACNATSAAGGSCSDFQTWSGCSLRDNLTYSNIGNNFFTARATTASGSTNFADFDGATTVPAITCPNTIRRVFYRFTYSSMTNVISAFAAYVLYDPAASTSRITIEWNDLAIAASSASTISRGYLVDQPLQFLRNNIASDVSALVPTSSGLCIDATRQTVRYKQTTTSHCFVQLQLSTMQRCHDLKLNLYLYLNVFYAPASHVLSAPNATGSPIQIRDDTQDSLDLDRIDETRPKNRLDTTTIGRTNFRVPGFSIYDTSATLPICFNVPSGIKIEFGYIRVNISATESIERIVTVRYNYVFSDWRFDCNGGVCPTSTTQRFPISFQSTFVDYTRDILGLGEATRADLTAADNYIQHLLWLISPEYRGEPGYRHYTIAMILIFIGITVAVLHAMLFGIVFPF